MSTHALDWLITSVAPDTEGFTPGRYHDPHGRPVDAIRAMAPNDVLAWVKPRLPDGMAAGFDMDTGQLFVGKREVLPGRWVLWSPTVAVFSVVDHDFFVGRFVRQGDAPEPVLP